MHLYRDNLDEAIRRSISVGYLDKSIMENKSKLL